MGFLTIILDATNFNIESLSSDKKENLYRFLSGELSVSDQESALVFKDLNSELSKS
jgi:hypothetical protein